MGTVELAEFVRSSRGQRSYLDVVDGLDLSHTYVWKVEHHQIREPSPTALRQLARGLGVPYHALMRAAGYL